MDIDKDIENYIGRYSYIVIGIYIDVTLEMAFTKQNKNWWVSIQPINPQPNFEMQHWMILL